MFHQPYTGLNWTKVGLKVADVAVMHVEPGRLNWTKVGLKVKISTDNGSIWSV